MQTKSWAHQRFPEWKKPIEYFLNSIYPWSMVVPRSSFSLVSGRAVALAVNFLGLIGLYPAIYYLLSKLGTNGPDGPILWGSSVEFWSAIIGTAAVVGACVLLVFVALWTDRSNYLSLLVERDDQIQSLEKKSLKLAERHFQKQVFKTLSHLYGYHLTDAAMSYVIRSDGTADCTESVTFHCTRRSLGSWQRVLQSSLTNPSASKSRVMDGFTVTPRVQSGGTVTVEILDFEPTLQKSDGPKLLQLVDSHGTPQQPAFLVTPLTSGPQAGRKNDWVSFAPSEPIARLTLSVEFMGIPPRDVTCTALRGRTKEVIPSESAEIGMRMERKYQNTHRFYMFTIEYPILGVSYRIDWSVA